MAKNNRSVELETSDVNNMTFYLSITETNWMPMGHYLTFWFSVEDIGHYSSVKTEQWMEQAGQEGSQVDRVGQSEKKNERRV